MGDFLTRRKFFCTLAASVVAVGMPLPIGFPEKELITYPHNFHKSLTIVEWHFHCKNLIDSTYTCVQG